MQLKPKNWSVFQHYKDRCPPWIKLHRDLLNDRTFMRLPLASKAIAPLMWLLASESKDGVFDGSIDELVFRLHITDKEYQQGVKPLIDNGFFLVASGVLADYTQVAIPETETERETETKKNKRGSRLAQDWVLTKSLGEWAQTERPDLNIRQVAEQFKDYWIAQAGQKGVKLDWAATWRNWVRNSKTAKPNLYDVARVTVPMSNEPDPALEKIKADEKTTRPPTQAEREMLASLKRKS
jgi:hypothetical protein